MRLLEKYVVAFLKSQPQQSVQLADVCSAAAKDFGFTGSAADMQAVLDDADDRDVLYYDRTTGIVSRHSGAFGEDTVYSQAILAISAALAEKTVAEFCADLAAAGVTAGDIAAAAAAVSELAPVVASEPGAANLLGPLFKAARVLEALASTK